MLGGVMAHSSVASLIASQTVPPPAKWAVYFDFDNTLTAFDVLDAIIARYSENGDWKILEEAWRSGEIDTRTCLDGQIRGLRVSPSDLEGYLDSIELDPHFIPIVKLLAGQGIAPVILSDSFTYFIKYVLANHGLSHLAVFANEVIPSGDRWIPSFPFHGKGCPHCAHCKRQHLSQNGKTNLFAGDGLSDFCGAEAADIVFAKATLLKHFKRNEWPCHEFEDLKPVHGLLQEWIHAHKNNEE